LYAIFLFIALLVHRGAAIGQNLGYLSMATISFSYIRISGLYKDTWPGRLQQRMGSIRHGLKRSIAGWSTAMFKDWGPFFKLGFKGALLYCVEYWVWTALVLTAGEIMIAPTSLD
jgi:hypothetical protein